MRKNNCTRLALPVGLVLLAGASPARAIDEVGLYGSVNTQKRASAAATAMKRGDFARAQSEYRALVGLNPKVEDFYFGYYQSSKKLKQWPDAELALDGLFELNPAYRKTLSFEWGECLFNMNKYDAAEPVLKQALTRVDSPSVVDRKVRRLMRKSIVTYKPVQLPYKPGVKVAVKPVPVAPLVTPEQVNPISSKKGLQYKYAFLKSECIVVAEFKRYEKPDHLSFYRPPKAIFKIVDPLKSGEHLNKTLPIKFEFHDKTDEGKPKGWKFDESMMPEKGSKWILFIENARAVDGMYDTYHGSYGRQPYNEENYDNILRIINEHRGQTEF